MKIRFFRHLLWRFTCIYSHSRERKWAPPVIFVLFLVMLSDRAEAKMMEQSSSVGLDDSTSWMDTISAPSPSASPYFASGSTRGGHGRG